MRELSVFPEARAMEPASTKGIGERPNKHEIVRSRASGGRAISASERSLALLAGFIYRVLLAQNKV